MTRHAGLCAPSPAGKQRTHTETRTARYFLSLFVRSGAERARRRWRRARAYLFPHQTQYTARQALDFLEAQRPVIKEKVAERRKRHRASYHGGGRTL
jgi:hypothetical protein